MTEVTVASCRYAVVPTPVATSSNEVVFTRDERIGRITLNRPRALNALTTAMIEQLHTILDAWEADPGEVLLFESASPKAFCAGGDIRAIRQYALDGAHEECARFFGREYQLNARLAELSTPIVSLIDGICMGGGLGLSVHGAFRVVTDKAVLAMPETIIGFLPDVGASHFLSRLPGAVGTYLGLTGARLDAADALDTGLATHHVADIDTVAPALAAAPDAPIDAVLRSLRPAGRPASRLVAVRPQIDWCFGASSVPEIRARVRTVGTDWAHDTLHALDAASPQSLEVTLAVLLRARQQNLRQCLQTEFDVAINLVRTRDFVEGVRAGLVDKDSSPTWSTPQFAGFDPRTGSSTWNDRPDPNPPSHRFDTLPETPHETR